MKHFDENEFTMNGISVFDKMDKNLLQELDSLRELCGFPLLINSSWRSEEYNKAVGGSKGSYHKKGRAIDLHCTSSTQRKDIVKHALNLGLSCGVARTFIHCDNRDKQILFTY